MINPTWFGHRYPKFSDLELLASALGVHVIYVDIPFGLYLPNVNGVQIIELPERVGELEMIWSLAHELGHALQHSGPKGARSYGKEEAQANRWAAQALIPFDRIAAYGNACEDAMVAALSAHYEDLPYEDCPARELAGRIARIRLESLIQEVA
jgi:hypothetical protein